MSGTKSRCRGRRSRAIALAGGSVLAAMLGAVPVASGSPGPDPLARAARFARAFGQQALAQPGGVAVDAAGHVWVADTGHGRVVEFSAAGRVVAAFRQHLDTRPWLDVASA